MSSMTSLTRGTCEEGAARAATPIKGAGTYARKRAFVGGVLRSRYNGNTVEHGSASVEESCILLFEIGPGGLGVDVETKARSG